MPLLTNTGKGMINTMDKERHTIGMLLDIEHLYGEHEGRLGPILMTILLCLAAPLFYVYFGLFEYIPVWVFVPLAIVIAICVVLAIPGRQRYRLQMYRRRLHDEYTTSADMMRIRQIREDGLVEYPGDKVFYAVCCYNGTVEDELHRTKELRKFLNALVGDYQFDTYILNINTTEMLRDYYRKTHKFGKNDAGRNFVKIIDNTVELTETESKVQCTVYCIYATLSEWKMLRTQIDSAIRSPAAKCFKMVYRVSNPEELQEIIDMDTDTNVNIDDLLRRRYQTGDYGASRVLAYDPSGEIVIQDKIDSELERKTKKSSGFYVTYKETDAKESSTQNRATAKPDYYKPVVIGGSKVETTEHKSKSTKGSDSTGREERSGKQTAAQRRRQKKKTAGGSTKRRTISDKRGKVKHTK